MSFDFIQLANPGVRHIKPYQPGKPIDELRRELGISDIIKLASNENPLGPSPKALIAVQQVIRDFNLYPDGSGYELKQALAAKLAITPQQLTLGNGSDNLLAMVIQAFVAPGGEVIISQYAFATFAIATLANHGTPAIIPTRDWQCDLDAMLAAINSNTRAIFIANPNNPTGTWLNKQDLLAFLQKLPESVLLVLDEAYYEYVDNADFPDSIALQRQFPNLIITRTFSKAYGLAGLRIGYSITVPAIADILNRVRLPFNVSVPALAAAQAALADEQHVQLSLDNNKLGMQQLTFALAQLGLKVLPSVGNFFSLDLAREAQPIYQQLLNKGIIVRPLLPYGMPNHLRITIGTEPQNKRLIDALTDILKVIEF